MSGIPTQGIPPSLLCPILYEQIEREPGAILSRTITKAARLLHLGGHRTPSSISDVDTRRSRLIQPARRL
jgi:hypothetical protein